MYEQGLCLADGMTIFEFSFRNEIWLLIENKFQEAQTIQPTQKIATLSVNYRPRMVINYVDQIEEIEWKNKSTKTYIQKIKKKLMPEIYDVKKPYEKAIGYTREQIDKYLQGGISTGTIYKRGGTPQNIQITTQKQVVEKMMEVRLISYSQPPKDGLYGREYSRTDCILCQSF